MACHYLFTMNPQAFMSEESREGQQSSAALNITTSGGSPSSSVNMAKFQIPSPDILELNYGFLALIGAHGLLHGRTILWLQNLTKRRKLINNEGQKC